MLTTTQAKEYLTTQGITLPDFLVDAIFTQVQAIEACLSEHYSDATGTLIQVYLLGLLAYSQGDKFISSQSAPSGASQSYKYTDFSKRWNGLYNLLSKVDTEGCALGVVPADPSTAYHAGLWVATGGCHE